MTLQDTLTFETLNPEEVLKRAIKFEHSKLTTKAFQKTNAAATGGSSSNYTSGVRIKQEPVMAVRNLGGGKPKLQIEEKQITDRIITKLKTRKQNHVTDVEGRLNRDI